MHDLAVGEAGGQMLKRLADGGDVLEDRWVGKDRDVVFGKVDTSLQHSDQLDQLLFDWLQAFR